MVETAIMAEHEFVADPPSSARGSPKRLVVLHADDFGMNPAVTNGIIQGFDQGLLTSTSLLSNAPDADRALDRWRELESRQSQGSLASRARRERLHDPQRPFDLGIHLNLTQGRPLTGDRFPRALLDKRGCFPGVFSLHRRLRRHGETSAAAIEEELACQAQFMLDRGHQPTHLNGHQYIEMLPVVDRIVESLLQRFHIPALRIAYEQSWWKSFTWPGIGTTQWLIGGLKKRYARRFRSRFVGSKVFFAETFFGTMTAGTTSLDTMRALMPELQNYPFAEIGLHPAARPDAAAKAEEDWHDPLAYLRPRELGMLLTIELCDLLAASGCSLGRLGQKEVA
jgi:predicted glycoside hydrolase/deacetylase ChbG (UPF0249 family)